MFKNSQMAFKPGDAPLLPLDCVKGAFEPRHPASQSGPFFIELNAAPLNFCGLHGIDRFRCGWRAKHAPPRLCGCHVPSCSDWGCVWD